MKKNRGTNAVPPKGGLSVGVGSEDFASTTIFFSLKQKTSSLSGYEVFCALEEKGGGAGNR